MRLSGYLDPEYVALFTSDIKMYHQSPRKVLADFQFTYPGIKYELSATAQEISPRESEASFEFTWAPGRVAVVKASNIETSTENGLVVTAAYPDWEPMTLKLTKAKNNKYGSIEVSIENELPF